MSKLGVSARLKCLEEWRHSMKIVTKDEKRAQNQDKKPATRPQSRGWKTSEKN